MNKSIERIFWTILTITQVVIIIALKIIQDLAFKKAGVNHHLRFYKTKYNNQIFTNENIHIMRIVLILISILLVVHLIMKVYKKKMKLRKYIEIILSILCCGIILWMLSSSKAMSILVYPYMVFAAFVILFIQIIKIVLVK